jgi:sugar lactone lactonase
MIRHAFQGSPLCTTALMLGEGPSYDPVTDTAFWFNIVGKELHELDLSSGRKSVHALPVMCSVIARIDDKRQAVVSELGIHIRDRQTGAMELAVQIEAERDNMRSNDGRVHPSGALWFGTMAKTGEGRRGAGTIYHVAGTTVTPIFAGISIPNSICFSPDGATAYFVDTIENIIKAVSVDPGTGLPTGEPRVFSDENQSGGYADGAVCDADGNVWSAHWDGHSVHVINPSGQKTAIYELPAANISCPAFIGANADRLMLTSAKEDVSEAELLKAPQSGFTFELGVKVNGRFDPAFAWA